MYSNVYVSVSPCRFFGSFFLFILPYSGFYFIIIFLPACFIMHERKMWSGLELGRSFRREDYNQNILCEKNLFFFFSLYLFNYHLIAVPSLLSFQFHPHTSSPHSPLPFSSEMIRTHPGTSRASSPTES